MFDGPKATSKPIVSRMNGGFVIKIWLYRKCGLLIDVDDHALGACTILKRFNVTRALPY